VNLRGRGSWRGQGKQGNRSWKWELKGELERELVGPGELEQSWKGGNSLLGVGRGAGNMSLKGELEWAVGTGNWRGTWRGQLNEPPRHSRRI